MKKPAIYLSLFLLFLACLFAMCSEPNREADIDEANLTNLGVLDENPEQQHGGFGSQIKYGEHLVLIVGCHDCHTPKKMTAHGPAVDFSRALMGHPAQQAIPSVNRKEMEQKGLAVSDQLTAWIGPWGVSYAANLTSDKTGIGNWQEKNFIIAMRQGKHKGIPSARTLLPPMPWEMYQHMTDEELKAIFAYLKSTKPIRNVVPAPQPPLSAAGPGSGK